MGGVCCPSPLRRRPRGGPGRPPPPAPSTPPSSPAPPRAPISPSWRSPSREFSPSWGACTRSRSARATTSMRSRRSTSPCGALPPPPRAVDHAMACAQHNTSVAVAHMYQPTTNQPRNQPTNQPTNQQTTQLSNNQPTNPTTNQATRKPTANQPTSQLLPVHIEGGGSHNLGGGGTKHTTDPHSTAPDGTAVHSTTPHHGHTWRGGGKECHTYLALGATVYALPDSIQFN